MTVDDINKLIRKFIRETLAMPENSVRKANQTAPTGKQSEPFATVLITLIDATGEDDRRAGIEIAQGGRPDGIDQRPVDGDAGQIDVGRLARAELGDLDEQYGPGDDGGESEADHHALHDDIGRHEHAPGGEIMRQADCGQMRRDPFGIGFGTKAVGRGKAMRQRHACGDGLTVE